MEAIHYPPPTTMSVQSTPDLSTLSVEDIRWAVLCLLNSLGIDVHQLHLLLPPPGNAPMLPYWCSQLALPCLLPPHLLPPRLLPPPPQPPYAYGKCFQPSDRNGDSKGRATHSAAPSRDRKQRPHCNLLSKLEDSSVMRQFRRCPIQFELEDIRCHVFEFAKDQNGSRFIQQKLECVDADEKQMIFDELAPELSLLMNHKYGNYVVQKYFEFGSDEQKIFLVQQLQGNVLFLTLELYGCRVIQKAIETLPPEFQAEIISELEDHILECVKDSNGSHVIQKCIKWADPILLQSIVTSFTGKFHEMAIHIYGCRVVQRVLENCNSKQLQSVLQELLDNTYDLVLDQYGNYVIQHIIVHGSNQNRSTIFAAVQGHVCELAQHKFASNVVEKCLVHASHSERSLLIQELYEEENDLLTLMKDKFANYVLQQAIEIAEPIQKKMLVFKMQPFLHHVRKYMYAKHIVTKVERYVTKGAHNKR